jgi:tetratricopeptide (TPR) repeat protein
MRHFAYYRNVAEKSEVAALSEELPNLRAALEWGFAQDDRTPAYELLLRVALYWQQHCNVAEARTWFARACNASDTPTLMFGKMLRRAATFATIEDDYDAARDLTERARQVFQSLGDRAGVAEALHNLAVIEDRSGSAEEAADLYARALEEFEATNHIVGIITALYNLGLSRMHAGDNEAAKAYLERGMALCDSPAHADRLASFAKSLGDVALRLEEYDEAWRTLQRALEIKRHLQNRLDEVEVLFSIASLHVRRGELQEAQNDARTALLLARELSVPSLTIGCFELFSAIELERGNTARAREIMSLAKGMRLQLRYVYRIIDALDAQFEAMADVQPQRDARPEDAEKLVGELLDD